MNVTKVCQEYCIGCGLCRSEMDVAMQAGEKGFLQPAFGQNEMTESFLTRVCPINDAAFEKETAYAVWGERKGAYAAYAKDEALRRKASSGGVLTGLAIYLLENKLVDGIIHIVAEEDCPTETRCRVSRTREELIEGCGSRYAVSSPWCSLSKMAEPDKNYAAIGKPCDIKALRRLKQTEGRYNNILYLLSFFCAGMPSRQANEQLLLELDCARSACRSLSYRGNGWPGYATAVDTAGNEHVMEYSKAWGGILGRDVHPYCRMCFDGIGEAADIACGDGWYIAENRTPDFTERDGRNIVFVRTQAGDALYKGAVEAGSIVSTEWENLGQLEIIQKYQFTRRTTMQERLRAYKLFGRTVPRYDKKKMAAFAKKGNKKERVRIFLGTVKRILLKKI